MNLITGVPYLSDNHLKGFDNYKYRSRDTSPYSVYVVNPCWNKIVEFVPRWVAPNLMTLSGFLLVLSTYLLFSWYDYDFKNSAGIPSWVWLYCSVAQITGYHLDGMDGKQARRTKTSTPLGELFDHGLDSLAASGMTLATFSVIGLGGRFGLTEGMVFVNVVLAMLGFYITHWEKYNTGILYLPWIFDIIHQVVSLAYLLTALFGTAVWELLQHTLAAIGLHISLGPLYTTAMTGGTFVSILVSLWNVIVAYANKENKRDSLLDALSPWVPFCAVVTAFSIWAYISPAGILLIEPRCFCTAMGITFSNFTCHLIISQMSGVRFRVYHSLVALAYACIVVSALLPNLEVTALYAYMMLALISHLHFGYSVVKQLTVHFKIDCFRIPYERNS